MSTAAIARGAARTPRTTPAIATGIAPAWPVREETVTLHDLRLEQGSVLREVAVHFRLEGHVNAARDNVVLVAHALTGTAHASAWWPGIVGAGAPIDPTRHAVLCANLLGGCNGTTGPSDQDPDALPQITTRDQATVLARLLDHLGIEAPLLICGGSLGGMVTLEFAATFPSRVRGAVVLAAPAVQTAQGVAWNAIMRRAIAIGGAREGLALARMVGMLSYRTPEGLERRFGRARGERDSFLVTEWLDHHGEKLVARFDATSYGALIDAMDTHDVGRGRGGVTAALAPVRDRLVGVGITGDLLYPGEVVREWTDAVEARFVELASVHGHDAFLLETERVARIIGGALAAAAVRSPLRTAPPLAIVAGRTPARAASTRPLRVALAGCGHVGGALLDLLREQAAGDHAAPGSGPATPPTRAVRVQRVLVRDPSRARPALVAAQAAGLVAPDACITDPAALLDDDVDVLVEVIGGTTTAAHLMDEALRRGLRVVTANKALLGVRGADLLTLARERSSRLDFEGAVCGAIPIVRALRGGVAGVGVTAVHGILNGTSNYVLERVAGGDTLDDAVAEAQRLGFAEADPTRDLSGEDAEDKLRVLAWLAFGVAPASLDVDRRGLDAVVARWATRVARSGDRVKLLASCSIDGDRLVARIAPTCVPADSAWARVSGPSNRIEVVSRSAGTIVLEGAGAGGRATAGAVLADLFG
ncbi:MAG: homoserine O-acetyltransferase [Gemmatimonadetes bacterium]|nr:homoserine O-acetyltransferase [Gemmatimonadota bacterium]